MRWPSTTPLALVALEGEAVVQHFQHRRLRLLDLQEDRLVVAGHEQADIAVSADRADAHRLEHEISQGIAVEQMAHRRRQHVAIGREVGFGVETPGRVRVRRKMENARRLVVDERRARCGEMGEIVVAVQTLAARPGDQRRDLVAQRGVAEFPRLAFEVDPAVPDFERRQIGKTIHALAIGARGRGSQSAALRLRQAQIGGGDRDAGGEPLQVDGEIDAGKRLVEIVDVEENIVLWRGEGAEIHQMAVAASLHLGPDHRLPLQVVRHHRRRAAQISEGIGRHQLRAQRDQRRQAGPVLRLKDGVGVAVHRPDQLAMGAARRELAQALALGVAFRAAWGEAESLGAPVGTCFARNLRASIIAPRADARRRRRRKTAQTACGSSAKQGRKRRQ